MQNRLFRSHHKGVTGIVTALKANHLIGVFGVNVDNLSFSLISPLGANNHNISHLISPDLIQLEFRGKHFP